MLFIWFLTTLCCVVISQCNLLAFDSNSTNVNEKIGFDKGNVTMSTKMPDFFSFGPLPNRTKEITLIYTLTFGGYFQIGSPATETIRIALKRLSEMPNWLAGYNLRFERIEDLNLEEIAIPSLLT